MALIKCPECGSEVSDKAETCPKCGISIQKAVVKKSHKKLIIISIIVAVVLLIVIGGVAVWYLKENTCAFGHEWQEATCTEPKTCSKCGETEGQALGHKWINATCTEPKTCEVCGTTDGDALGHTTRMGYCDNCGQYIDDLLGVYNSLMSDLSDATDKLSEAMETMHLTSSYYDTKYVAQANQINYETKEFLNAAADEAYKYDEFSDVAYKIRNAVACICYFDALTEKTGFGSYEYETAMATSLGNCAQSIGDAILLLNDLKE